MTQPVEGADVTAVDDAPPAPRDARPVPIRPVLVELASALLIVGGITALVGWLVAQVFNIGVAANAGLLPAIFVGLNLVAIATGLLIRSGRHWRLCTNVVAISILLYVTGLSSPIAMFYLALYVVVFYALIQHRAWFDGKPTSTSDAP